MARQLRRSLPSSSVGAPAARRPALRTIPRPDLGRHGRGIGQFIGEVRSELRKVVWPTRREAFNLTALVVAMSVAVGVILGFIDYAFSELFRLALR
jgi:preprotein translocase subunit SecE